MLLLMPRRFNPDLDRRRSIRLQDHDYTRGAAIFVTSCAYERRPIFARVNNGAIELNDAGRIASQCWEEIPGHFERVELDEYVVMPNHVHGILVFRDAAPDSSTSRAWGTACRAPTEPGRRTTIEAFARPVPESLATVVRSFKAAVTKQINELHGTPAAPVWQRNYYEHVIRDENDLDRIREYIAANPSRWAEDELYVRERTA